MTTPASWDSDVQSYLRAVIEWPLLSPEETTRLAETIARASLDFRTALSEIPATARLLVEQWQERHDQGLVTGMMCHAARDDRKTDWTAHVDTLAREIRACLDADEAPDKAEISALVTKADILFELLEEIHTDLRALMASRSQSARRRRRELGLGFPPARRSLRTATAARARRDDAKQQFARSNLRLVVARAKRFRSMGVRFEDLIQEGNLGLLRAIDKFEPDRGYRFSTYAVWWIDQALIRAIQNQSRTIRVPSHLYDRIRELRRTEDRIQLATGSDPSLARVAHALGIDEDELEALRANSRAIRSIDERIGERQGDPDGPNGRALVDVLADPRREAPEDTLHQKRVQREIARGLQGLPARERQVLSLRYGIGDRRPMSLREIGRDLGVTGERVRQIELGALSVLASRGELASLAERDEPADAGARALVLGETG